MENRSSVNTLIIACTIFLFFGVITAGLGPILPELAQQTASNLTAVGGVFTAIFLGALVSQLVSGSLNDRFGQKKVLSVSLIVLAAGTFGFTSVHSFWLMLAVAFFAGLGHGSVDLSTNVLISRTFSKNNASVMNLLHFFFGLGAFGGPALISYAMSAYHSGIVVLWIASAGLLILVLFVLVSQPVQEERPTSGELNENGSIYKSTTLWLLGGLLLVYVGVENGISGWAPTYMNSTTTLSLDKAALVTSGFWGALTVGRLVTALIGNRLKAAQILMITFSLALLFGLMFSLSTGNQILSIASIVLIGFFSGAVYPTVMSLLTTTYVQSPGKAASVGAAMGSIGGMVIPWIQGFLLENVSPASSAWFATSGLGIMVCILWLIRRNAAKSSKI